MRTKSIAQTLKYQVQKRKNGNQGTTLGTKEADKTLPVGFSFALDKGSFMP
jgi:hypothetical protein